MTRRSRNSHARWLAAAILGGMGGLGSARAQTPIPAPQPAIWHPQVAEYQRIFRGARWEWNPALGWQRHEYYLEVPATRAARFVFGAEIQQVHKRAIAAAPVPSPAHGDLAMSEVDPRPIVAVFPPLKVGKGFVLRGEFTDSSLGATGRALAYGRAASSGNSDAGHAAPLADVMEAIEGDGSPWSYLCASILDRELGEFSARWHGQNWTTHTVLVASPWDTPNGAFWNPDFAPPTSLSDRWEWSGRPPKDWRPSVTIAKDVVTVQFYTYSPLGQEAVRRHVDTFRRGSYRFTSREVLIAKGPRHMVF